MIDKKNIYQKLIEVRKSIDSFKKDTDGYNFRYVSGSQVLTNIKKDLDNQGIILESHLTYPQVGKSDRGYLVSSPMKMIWVNADDPKDRIEIDWFMVGEQKDPSQSFGSGLTYAERYFMLKFFNIPTDEDDPDKLTNKGNEGKTDEKKVETKPKAKSGNIKLVTEKQIKRYYAMVKEAGIDIDKMDKSVKKCYKVEHKSQLTMEQIDKIFKVIEKKTKEKKGEEQLGEEFDREQLTK